MKLKHFLLIIMSLGIITASEAQLLKKLKKKAEQAAERTILNKTDEKVSQKTGEAIGSVTTKKPNKKPQDSVKARTDETEDKISKFFGGGLENVPDSYTFSYLLTYQITSNKEEFAFQYFLEPNAPYFANKMADSKTNSFVVYDLKKNFMVTFMDDGKQKMAMKMVMPNMKKTQKKYGDKLFPDKGNDEVKIVPLEGKMIQGYHCLGFLVTSKDGQGTVWITNEAPVSLNGVFSNFKTLPKTGPYANLPINESSMIMEMDFKSNKKKSDNMHMICSGLKQEIFKLLKEDYSSGQ